MLSISENLPPLAKAESPRKRSALFLLNQHFQLSDCASMKWNKFYPDHCEKIVHRQYNQENKSAAVPSCSWEGFSVPGKMFWSSRCCCGLIQGLCGSENYSRHHCYYMAEKLLKLPTKIYYCPQN